MCYAAIATLVTLLLALPLAPVAADTVNANANADAYVHSGHVDTNYGSSNMLQAGQESLSDGNLSRSLINFDTTSAVPEDKHVDQVILHLTTFGWGTYSGEDALLGMFSVDGDWSENSVTWNNMPGLGDQIGDTTYAVTGTAPDELTWDVTSVWTESTTLDFYLAVTNPSTGRGFFQAWSQDATYDAPPYLQITYSDAAVPEPCTLALMGVGLAGLLLKRRREAA